MYEPQTWVLGISGGTPLNDVRLNYMEQGIADAHSLIADLATATHTHVSADITDATASNVPSTIVERDSTGSIAVTAVSGLSTATGSTQAVPKSQLDSAIATHSHVIANVAGLQDALDAKANLVHTHLAADVTDFPEAVAGVLVEGTGIDLSFAAGQVTINSTGSSPTLADMPASTLVFVNQNGDGTWPNRPTSRTDVKCMWTKAVVGSADPAAVTSPAVNGAYGNDLVVGV